MLTWLATSGVGLALGFLAKVLTTWIGTKINAEQRYRDGASDMAAKTNQENADADRRASQAQANAPTGGDLDDRLATGRIRF